MGVSFINLAVSKNFLEVVKALILKGVSIVEKDDNDSFPLYEAASLKNPKLLFFLLDNGALESVNVSVSERRTPISIAVRSNLHNNVVALVMSGADFDDNILQLAKEVGNESTIEYLKNTLEVRALRASLTT